MSEQEPDHNKSDVKELSKYLSQAGDAAVSLTVLILLGIWGGQWMDERLHTSPWGALSLAVLGLCLGLWRVIHKTLKM